MWLTLEGEPSIEKRIVFMNGKVAPSEQSEQVRFVRATLEAAEPIENRICVKMAR